MSSEMDTTIQEHTPKVEISFRFMDLPNEMRLIIYEDAVNVDFYEPELRPRGKYTPYWGGIAPRTRPPDPDGDGEPPIFYPWRGPMISGYSKFNHATERPAILAVSSHTRQEALPLFYTTHVFDFVDCGVDKVLEWLLMVGKAVNLKYIDCVFMPEFGLAEHGAVKAIALLMETFGFSYGVARKNDSTFTEMRKVVRRMVKRHGVTKESVVGLSKEKLLEMVAAWPQEGGSDAEEEVEEGGDKLALDENA